MEDRKLTLEYEGGTYTGYYVVDGSGPDATVTVNALGAQESTRVGDSTPEVVAKLLFTEMVKEKAKP